MAGRGKRREVVEMLSGEWVQGSVRTNVARLKLRLACGHVVVTRSNTMAKPLHALCVSCAAVGVEA